MKARDLIERLKAYHPDTIVVLSKDAEGNAFSPVADVSEQYYVAENKWSGYLVDDEDLAENDDNVDSAAVIWPIN